MISLSKPIEFDDPDAAAFLSSVQGNILKSHGRDHTARVFVRFRADTRNVRAWISKFAIGNGMRAGPSFEYLA